MTGWSAPSRRQGPFPEQAARAQADYDCWVLDSAPGMVAASAGLPQRLDGSLMALENAARPAPPPLSRTGSPAAPAAAPAPSDYTAYFDFDSWTLTAEDLAVITNVINTARAGGQSHITVVGHTDTSGSADYNQEAVGRRANVVVEALVDMGARRAAIQARAWAKPILRSRPPTGSRKPRTAARSSASNPERPARHDRAGFATCS